MRAVARLKLGYYPLPVAQGPLLRTRLSFPSGVATALDPCAGTGAALQALTAGANTQLFGVELDSNRAAAANAAGVQTIQGNLFDVRGRSERLSLLYLNPPYDFEIGPLANERMERLFLGHTYTWLKPKGILVMVIPGKALLTVADTLAARFKDIAIYRMEGRESEQYDQVAVFAIRGNNNGNAVDANLAMIRRLHGNRNAMRPLTAVPDTIYAVPEGSETVLTYIGIPLDAVEDRLPSSQAWSYAVPLLLPKAEIAGGRPITPLHGGHVGLLATAGMLNGVFGDGAQRHIARWRPVKHTIESREVEEGTEIIRRRERFSNELALVFSSGETLILTETAKGEEPAKVVNGGGETLSSADCGELRSMLGDGKHLFPLGRLLMTREIQDLMLEQGVRVHDLLSRHAAGDWGEMEPGDSQKNDHAVTHGDDRIFSSYNVPESPDEKIWIITEEDRSVTTVLLPSEY